MSAADAKQDPIEVFDGVFAPDIAEVLGDYGPGVYRRWMMTEDPDAERTPIEEFIESILLAADDSAKEVEYWGRTDWLAVEGHRDSDEGAAAAGIRRFPSRVYIAYLDIVEGLLAPTVLWTPSHHTDSEAVQGNAGLLVAIPAVPGRLLSFEGPLLHGVPRPACQYLGVQEPGSGKNTLRHVLIINSWPEFAPDDDDDDLYDEDSQDSDDDLHHLALDAEHATSDDSSRSSDAPSHAGQAACTPRALWRPTPLLQHAGADDGEGTERCVFSIPIFGSDDAFVTHVAGGEAEVASMLSSESSPGYLRTVAAASAGDVTDLQIGVPSEEGTRQERTD